MKKDTIDWSVHGPLIAIPLLITIALTVHNHILGFLGFLGTLFLVWHVITTEKKRNREFVTYVESLGTDFDRVAKNAVFSMPFALALTDGDGTLMWYNTRFSALAEMETPLGRPSDHAIPGLSVYGLSEKDPPIQVKIGEKSYLFYFTILRDDKTQMPIRILLYGIDYTKESGIELAHRKESLVIGLVYLDNYDELRQGLAESERTIMFAGIDSMISEYFVPFGGMVRKYETDKYLIVLNCEQSDKIMERRFDILDRIKTKRRDENSIAPSLSIGFGTDGVNPMDTYRKARTAIDVALGRGGDQAVVKRGESLDFYGGKNKAVEKRTKVKARVIAHAVQQLIDQSDQVFVMGHKNADMDSYGSAIGILSAVRARKKRGYLVLTDINPSITEIAKTFSEMDIDMRPAVIDGETAVERYSAGSLLIVVDTHRQNATEEPRLLNMAPRIVLIDHHRRGQDYIVDPTLTYLEPYASSTSELVTEMLQYMDDTLSVTPEEASALLAGIMVDTKNFNYQTGVRTFEAAALLKRAGADSALVKRFFKDSFDTYLAKAGVIRNTKIIDDHIAIGRLYGIREDGILIAAQSADEMLGIRNIDASFVLTEIEKGTHLSARSLGGLSVQLIAEKLGGGGHQTQAGAQLIDVSIEEAEARLIEAIHAYEREEKTNESDLA